MVGLRSATPTKTPHLHVAAPSFAKKYSYHFIFVSENHSQMLGAYGSRKQCRTSCLSWDFLIDAAEPEGTYVLTAGKIKFPFIGNAMSIHFACFLHFREPQ